MTNIEILTDSWVITSVADILIEETAKPFLKKYKLNISAKDLIENFEEILEQKKCEMIENGK